MCRLLIWNKSGNGESGHHRGDVISVVPNKHKFTAYECKAVHIGRGKDPALWDGHTWVIDIPDMTERRARRLLESDKVPAVEGDSEFDSPDEADRFKRRRIRKFRLNFSGPKLDALHNVGRVSLTIPQARNFFQNLAGDGEVIDFGS